jgi:hypothetical protein
MDARSGRSERVLTFRLKTPVARSILLRRVEVLDILQLFDEAASLRTLGITSVR